jgi:hypothetical protein
MEKAKSMLSELREELTKILTKNKKDVSLSSKKRDDDLEKTRAELDMLHQKTSQDHSQMLEKL